MVPMCHVVFRIRVLLIWLREGKSLVLAASVGWGLLLFPLAYPVCLFSPPLSGRWASMTEILFTDRTVKAHPKVHHNVFITLLLGSIA